ncbi:MAG: hypothetical protein ACM3PP_05060 [Candidatus Saccharibacteria bacterium]
MIKQLNKISLQHMKKGNIIEFIAEITARVLKGTARHVIMVSVTKRRRGVAQFG